MKKVISIFAILLFFAGAAWFNASCNKDTDTTAIAAAPTEEVIVSAEGEGVADRSCSPCDGYRSFAPFGGEATDYTIRIFNRICPENPWSLIGTWDEVSWPIFPTGIYAFSIEHGKTYKVEVTNNSAVSAYFTGIKIYNTSLLTNFNTGAFSVAPSATYTKIFSPVANCGCSWTYGCGPK